MEKFFFQCFKMFLVGSMMFAIAGCGGMNHQRITTVNEVNLDRFMGDWYVIANIPTFIEKGAHNAVESYALNEDGSVSTTFRFNAGSFDGKEKVYRPTGFIQDRESNAVWAMQFIWPFKAEYRILYLDEAYTQTIIGRSARDYVWIMARSPEMSDADFERLVAFISREGYDVQKLQKVPQFWP